MSLLDDPTQFEQLVRHLRGTSVFRLTSRYDLARLLSVATLKTATAGEVICVPAQGINIQPSPSFFILLTGDYDLDGGTRLGGMQDGLAGIEHVLRRVPRSIPLPALWKGTYLEVPASITLALIASSTPLRQTLVPLVELASMPMTYVEPSETGVRGNIVQFISSIVDTPMSLMIELLAREIAARFTDHVIVLRKCPPGQPPSPVPVKVDGVGLGELYYAFVDPVANPNAAIAYCPHFDYVFLDGIPSGTVDTVVKLFFGYPEDYIAPPPVGSPRLLQTVVIGQPPLPCSKELYFVNANPSRTSHASDCRIRVDLVQLRALEKVWNPYLPLVDIDEKLIREMGIWARALTQRRTGIALAGGGVWSMQSIYIIRELNKRGVPLDVITGASAGAMIGGYYSVLGLPGLDLIVEQGDRGVLDVVVTLWMLAPCFAQAFFENQFGSHTCLDNLAVDFRPNSTNLTIGEGVAFIRGPVASAVRAAASAPPLVAPTFSRSQRFVDGAFSNNVAAQILPYFGANLTFAANTYPPSRRPKPAFVPDFVTRISSLGPINRMLDFTVALNLLANLTGKVEGGYADVGYNAESNAVFPFLITTNFCQSSKMVEFAETDPRVNAAIDEFTLMWEHSRRRGGRTWTTTPS